MTTRFLIPTAVTMSFHLFAFFGFHPASHQATAAAPEPPIRGEIIRILDDEPPPTEETAVKPAAETHGEPEVVRTPETFVRENESSFSVPVVERPAPLITSNHLTLGSIGTLSGTATEGPEVVSSTYLDNPPRTRAQIAPVYPYEARNGGRSGEVLVEFVVDESGRVLNPQVVRSSDPAFDAPTLRAITKWRFEPGRRHGRPVRFHMALPVQFSVND